MSKTLRVSIFVVSVIFLLLIIYFWQGNILPNTVWATIIFTSLIMISFVMLFLEHWFTKPTDVLASTISILLVLAPLDEQLIEFGIWYTIFFCYNLIVAIVALIALILLDKNKPITSFSNRISSHFHSFATRFGNGRFLYFSLFFLTLLFYVDSQSNFFLVLFLYSMFVLLADPVGFFVRFFF